MATPSDTLSGEERRLHPLSWLFAVLLQIRSFAIPIVVLLLTGRGDRFQFVGLVGVGGIALTSLAQYLTYRFRFDDRGIVIRSGFIQRTTRDIPYARIHNVVIHQSLLHRVFDVAEVRLESAGGDGAEARMRVLSMDDARAIEALLRERGASRAETASELTAPAEASETLLAMSTAEVVRLGLISNRGMVLVAAAFGALWQVMPDQAFGHDPVRRLIGFAMGQGREMVTGWLDHYVGLAIGTVALLFFALVIVRALSVTLALLQFHGFRLTETSLQLRVERGLLTRVRAHLPRARIQAWRLTETFLHRRFGRQSLRVESAAHRGAGDESSVRDLVPLAAPEVTNDLIAHLLPGRNWPPAEWKPLHPRAWRRRVVVPASIIAIVTAVFVIRYGAIGLMAGVMLPLVFVRARLWARNTGYAEVNGLIVVREGWLNRSWRFTEITKLQALRLTESPFDRRHGMATIWIDTAGADATAGVIRVPYLPAAEARLLHDRLARELDGR